MDLTPYYGLWKTPHFHRVNRDARHPTAMTMSAVQALVRRVLLQPLLGIGGVFFDDFSELGFEGSFAMMRAVGDAFIPAYLPIGAGAAAAYTPAQRDLQNYRRGRYVESTWRSTVAPCSACSPEAAPKAS